MSGTFTFDVTLTATVEVTADSVAEAVEALREMQGANPLITLFRGEHGTVESAGKYQGTTVRLAHLANGEPINLPMDDMDEPVICEQYEAGTQVADCHLVYDETRGDGYCGTCPACADAGLGAP
jgi:hypothetical protein